MPSRSDSAEPAVDQQALAQDPMALAEALHAAAWTLMGRMRPYEKLEGVSAPAIWAFSKVAASPGITPLELARVGGVTPPTVWRALKELDAAGMIQRRPDPNDGRTQRLHATVKGLRCIKSGRKRRIRHMAEVLLRLGVDERRGLVRAAVLLAKLNEL